MLSTLKRRELEAPDAKYSAATKSLATEAGDVLGYKPLQNVVFQAVGESTDVRMVNAVFADHGIEPFDRKRVDKYKRLQVARANRWTKVLQLITTEYVGIPAFFGTLVGAVITVAFLAHSVHQLVIHKPIQWHWGWIPLMTIPLALIFKLSVDGNGKRREIFAWSLERLNQYRKPVPEFALARAVELKRALPEAEFFVDELAGGTYVTLDPFMVMDYHGSRYYVDVWNEPKFEGRRTK